MEIKLAENIKKFRKEHSFTQEQLADLMNVSIQMVSNLERGNKAIRIDNLINLCRILHVSTDYILTGKETVNLDVLSGRLARLSDTDQKMIEMLVEYCIANKT